MLNKLITINSTSTRKVGFILTASIQVGRSIAEKTDSEFSKNAVHKGIVSSDEAFFFHPYSVDDRVNLEFSIVKV